MKELVPREKYDDDSKELVKQQLKDQESARKG